MALLKALNDSCKSDVHDRLVTCQLRRSIVEEQKTALQDRAKAELVRPGSLAAAFTLGWLVAPGKNEEKQRGKRIESRLNELKAQGNQKQKEDEGFDLASMLTSVLSSVAIRFIANKLTGSDSSNSGSPSAAADSADREILQDFDTGHPLTDA